MNDWAPRFRESVYEFNISSELPHEGMSLGQIEVADGDLGDQLTLEIKNSDFVEIDNEGRLYLKNRSVMKKREMMFLVVAKDSGEPPREAFVPVVVRFHMMEGAQNLHQADFDMKIALIAALALVALALVAGILLYFGYCR